MPIDEKNKAGRTEIRVMPDTVRTAGAETIRETDLGTVISKSKNTQKSEETPAVKKTIIKTKKVPDTVRTAGASDIMATDD